MVPDCPRVPPPVSQLLARLAGSTNQAIAAAAEDVDPATAAGMRAALTDSLVRALSITAMDRGFGLGLGNADLIRGAKRRIASATSIQNRAQRASRRVSASTA